MLGTLAVGCNFSDKIVFHDYFADNSDSKVSWLMTETGIYNPNCGLDNVHMTWGHDEYLYHVVKKYLPAEALFLIRYHSFYALHREDAYHYLLNDQDKRMLPLLKRFSNYDLYSKEDTPLNLTQLKPYYQQLVAKYFGEEKIDW